MALVIPIADYAFAHAPGMSWYNTPAHFQWTREDQSKTKVRFFTDRSVGHVDTIPAERNVALMIEPRQFDDTGLKILKSKLDKFHYVLTYDRDLVQTDPSKFLYYAIGGCWVDQPRRTIALKSALVSMIASAKNSTPGHKLRHEVVKRLDGKVEILGGIRKPIQNKGDGLCPFSFSIAIENCQINDYFTEKIVDCFVTGTVPIYWGTQNIDKYFDPRGILQFNTVDELEGIVNSLSATLYTSMLPYIEDNFRRAQNYLVAEDWIYRTHPFLFV
ncbi:MAG: glycosyltransferase family 10 domain-containing protein [Planctomycetota bacterium]|jgi:hypothetical protein